MKINKKILLSFICGAIVFGTVGVYATSQYLAKDIGFTPSDRTWQVDNLEDAINDLYDNSSNNNNTNNSDYVKDGLEIDIDYKKSLGFYGNTTTVTEDGFKYTGSQYILAKRYQNPYMTYEAYVKLSTVANAKQVFISSTENGGCALQTQLNTLASQCYISGAYRSIKAGTLEADNWYHTVLTAGEDGMKLYLNGELIGQNEYKSITSNQSNTITMIGSEPSGASVQSGFSFNGYIKYARVYNRGLTEEEVLKNYNYAINNY